MQTSASPPQLLAATLLHFPESRWWVLESHRRITGQVKHLRRLLRNLLGQDVEARAWGLA